MASDAEVLSDRRQRMFNHLVEAEQWDRVLELDPQLLADDQENWFAHAGMTRAALQVDDDLKRARRHGRVALWIELEESLSHLLMARIYRET